MTQRRLAVESKRVHLDTGLDTGIELSEDARSIPTYRKGCKHDGPSVLASRSKTSRITNMRKAKAKKSRPRPWSEGEVKLLKRLFTQGRARDIAEQTGRSLEAVKHKAYNMGIKTRECRHWLKESYIVSRFQ